MMSETRNGTIVVDRTYLRTKKGQEAESSAHEEKTLEVQVFQTAPAGVECRLGRTVNLGSYESLRVDVGVTLPCYAEEVVGAQDYVFDLASMALEETLSKAKATFGK
jgi:hypothetical protein